MLKRFAQDTGGATAIEYGLIVAVLSLAMVGGFSMFGNALSSMFLNQAAILDDSVTNLN
jgi:pilus assembly protein Flp/PilA